MVLKRPSYGKLGLTIVFMGVGILLGGYVVGEGGLCAMVQNR